MINNFKKIGIEMAYSYIEKNPEKNLLKLMDLVDRIDSDGHFPTERRNFRRILNNPNSNWYKLIMRMINETDTDIVKTFFNNMLLNAGISGTKVAAAARKKYNCNIPYVMVIDPTSACNLKCIGCWAAQYGQKLNLTFDELDSIIKQGKELGVYFYIYTGGEPLVRKRDIIALCEKHSDCIFTAFTNATLIDEEFAREMLRVKNFVPSISVEGTKETHDARRGAGSYDKVVEAMKILKSHRLPFAVSCCYTSQNYDVVTSEAFFDQMIDWGAFLVWFFHYMPIGNDAQPSLLLSPQMREYVYRKIRGYRSTKAIFSVDFQNDAEYIVGCIAGGRRFLHINANGDVDPCVFIHYSDSNIREKSLLDCLRSPLFMAYRKRQPFNKNHLRPCPMLENPEKLREIVAESGAKSTDLMSPEDVDHLCSKCDLYAKNWKPEADRIWAERHRR